MSIIVNMDFEEFLSHFQGQKTIDRESIALFFPRERPDTVRSAIWRFKKEGKLISLRRGLYALGSLYRKASLTGPEVANSLYQPSALSGLWALSFWGIIPEQVLEYTSVTPRVTKRFANEWGSFSYRSLKQGLFFGYGTQDISGAPVMIAGAEKALLDLWYLEEGEWTRGRMASYRFDPEGIDQERLRVLEERFSFPRIKRAVDAWSAYAAESRGGERL